LKDRSLEEVTEESVIKQIAPRIGLSMKSLRTLSIEQQWDQVLQVTQDIAGTAGNSASAEEINRLAVSCKAHLMAIGRYQPERIDLDFVMINAARPWRLTDPRWSKLARKFKQKSTPGSHYSMLTIPDVTTLARTIESILEDIQIGGSIR
jgi:thioesterase domain-containing protein